MSIYIHIYIYTYIYNLDIHLFLFFSVVYLLVTYFWILYSTKLDLLIMGIIIIIYSF